jgi:CubicO group peptidase (beta-lactamase class C family)
MKYPVRSVLFALLGILTFSQAFADELDEYVRREMNFLRIPGLSMAIKHGDLPTRIEGYGSANLETMTPIAADTVFQIGSLTKSFTATAVMLLVEEGKVALDDKITARLSGLPASWDQVTIRQLLSHTSGIKEYTTQDGMEQRRRLDSRPEELLGLVTAAPLEFSPGSRHSYSNTNYLLLALLIEQLSGRSYARFLAERILTPLEMTQTRVNDPAEIVPHRAQGYVRVPGRIQNAAFFSTANALGAGDLISSARDLTRWDAALNSGKLLSKARLEEMWTPAALSPGGAAPYGFGWGTKTEKGNRLITHGGNISGFSSAYLYCPELRLTVVVLTNLGDINAEKLAAGIAGKIEPGLARQPRPPIADSDPQLTARLQRVFLGMMMGDMNAGDFDEQLNRDLGPRIRPTAEAKMDSAENGRLERFELVARQSTDKGLALQYRATFEYRMRAIVFITLDAHGKISSWGVRPAD